MPQWLCSRRGTSTEMMADVYLSCRRTSGDKNKTLSHITMRSWKHSLKNMKKKYKL